MGYTMLSSTKPEQKFPGDFTLNGPAFVNRFGLTSSGKALDYGIEGKVVSPGEDDEVKFFFVVSLTRFIYKSVPVGVVFVQQIVNQRNDFRSLTFADSTDRTKFFSHLSHC